MILQNNVNKISLKELISPKFYEVHKVIKQHRYSHFYLKGGRGSTKSSFISLEIILGIIKDKDANAVVIRKVSNTIYGSVYEQLKWAIEVLGLADFFDGIRNPFELRYLPTGQRIVFRGADDPKKLKSTKFSRGYCKFVHYEELDEFTPEDIRSINQTLLRGGEKFVVFYSYNPPKSVQSWVNTEILISRPDRLIHHSTYLDVPKHWLGEQFFIEAEHLKATKEQSYRHEYLGEVTGTGGEVFENVKIREITDDQISHFDNIKRGLDFGYSIDPLCYGEMYFNKKYRKLYIFFEIYKVQLKNSQAIRLIKKQNPNNGWIIADREPRTIAEFKELGLYNITQAQKPPDSIEHGIKFLQDLEEIIIDPVRCPNTAREFTSYELQKDKDGNFKAKFPDKNNHSIDCVRYSLEKDMIGDKILFLK